MEAAEPEERAAEEKRVEEKSGERKRENIGSVEKEERGSLMADVEDESVLSLKVESFWRGEEEEEEDGGGRGRGSGEGWIVAGDAIVGLLWKWLQS